MMLDTNQLLEKFKKLSLEERIRKILFISEKLAHHSSVYRDICIAVGEGKTLSDMVLESYYSLFLEDIKRLNKKASGSSNGMHENTKLDLKDLEKVLEEQEAEMILQLLDS